LPYLFRDIWPPLDLILLSEYQSLKVFTMQNFLLKQQLGSTVLPIGTDGFLNSMHLGSKAGFSDNFKPLASNVQDLKIYHQV
jgi:hypothetical protein